jgi:hypothetical protein
MCQLHVADAMQHTFRMPHTISGAFSATSHWRRMCIRVGISIPETGTKRAVPVDLSSMEDCAGYGNRVGNASLSTTLVSHTYPKNTSLSATLLALHIPTACVQWTYPAACLALI